VGGRLLQVTEETGDNRYFAHDELPESLFGPDYVGHALADVRPMPQTVNLSRTRTLQTQVLLRWRWVRNLLRGRPEPRFARFTVRAVAAIYSEDHQRIITLPKDRGRSLPRVGCDGRSAPWVQLGQLLRQICPAEFDLQWVGLWQEPDTDTLELAFAASIPTLALNGQAEWSYAQNAPVDSADSEYIRRIQGNPATTPAWMVISQPAYDVIIPG
jgi:hypothetical protein